jgi:type IV pilus assembly protein PilM
VFNFLKNRHWPIALDLGSDSIKMLQVKRVGPGVHVSACAKWRYPEALRNDPLHRRQAAVEAVREMLRKGGFHGRSVVSALPSSDLTIKNIRLPSTSPEDLVGAIRAEARERLGFEVSPEQISYLHAGQVRQGNETREEVILMAAPRAAIDSHVSLLDEMGLRAQHIEAEPIALFRVFERYLRRRSDEQVVSVIMDVGYRATRVLVARGRQIVFTRVIEIGGARFHEAVAKQLNVPVTEAVELRRRSASQRPEETQESPAGAPKPNPHDAVDWTLHDALRGEVELLGKEIALCLRYCSVTFRGIRSESAVLTGGEAHDPSIVRLLGEHLGLPCKVGYPLRGIGVSEVDLGGDRRSNLAEWTLSAGLAFRGGEMPEAVREDEDGQRDRLSA